MFHRLSDRLQLAVPGSSPALGLQPGTARLLPNEPRLANPGFEQALTERHLLPALPALEAFFLGLRHLVDSPLQRAQPVKLGKPYPLGQCLEITLAVSKLLERGTQLTRQDAEVAGHAALRAFIKDGGTVRHVWGDLRGQFFQNAFLIGSLYVDVSNDTVVPTKPKVEILPFEASGLSPIKDYAHFQRIASTYWKSRFFPNHVFPELAPFCPLLRLAPDDRIFLTEPCYYMMALTLQQQFRPSEAMLRAPLLPMEQFEQLRELVQANSRGGLIRLAINPEDGRRRALELCRRYRARHWSLASIGDNPIMRTVRATHQHMIQWQAQRAAPAPQAPVQERPVEPPSTGTYLVISRKAHAQHQWRVSPHFGFTAGDMLVALHPRELQSAAQCMPTAFLATDAAITLVGLQGLQPGRNLLVDAAGTWRASHLPETYRCYPFAVTSQGEETALCILHTSCLPAAQPDSAPLFNPDGAPTAKVQQVLEFLTNADQDRRRGLQLCAQLQAHALLRPWPLQLDASHMLNGLLQVDAAALQQLSAEAREELQRSGALQLACCQLQSMQHLQTLQQLAAATPPVA